MNIFLSMLFWFVCAHFICDYCWQSDTVAREKSPSSTTELQRQVPWYYWMMGHASMHGVAVALITKHVWLGIAEVLAHFVIDYGKCRKRYNIHHDQIFHLVCKLVWASIAVGVTVWG